MAIGLDGRQRNLNGRIRAKRGDTLISTLRKHHGADFLPKFKPSDDLSDARIKLDEPSLTQLEKHYPAPRD